MLAILGILLILALIAGQGAQFALADRLRNVAPEVYENLDLSTSTTHFWYGRLPHSAGVELSRFVWRRAFLQVNDHRAQQLGWVAFCSPLVTLLCVAGLVLNMMI